MLRNTIFSLALVALAGCAPAPLPVAPIDPNGVRVTILNPADTPQIQFRHVDAINALRMRRDLQPLVLSPELNAAAATHARDMWVQQRAWHFGSDGSSPQERATRAGFNRRVVSHNIAETYEAELQLLEAFMADPDVAATIYSPQATHIGIDWFQERDGKIWWVQIIGDANRAAKNRLPNPTPRLNPEPDATGVGPGESAI